MTPWFPVFTPWKKHGAPWNYHGVNMGWNVNFKKPFKNHGAPCFSLKTMELHVNNMELHVFVVFRQRIFCATISYFLKVPP